MTAATRLRQVTHAAAWGAAILGFYLIQQRNYLLFHTLVELFSAAIAIGVFAIFWNTRRLIDNSALVFLGVAFLFTAQIDLLHTLAYKGVGIFPGDDANLPTQLWIVARYMQSLSLFIAPWLIGRKLKAGQVFAGYIGVVGLALASIFYGNIFPDCFTENGLTPFKRGSEYLISFVLIASIGGFWWNRQAFTANVLRWLMMSVGFAVAAELAFTLYATVYALPNFIGHVLKSISMYYVYKAFIETCLLRPYELIFHNLKDSESSLRALVDAAPGAVLLIAPDGRVLVANDRASAILGISEEILYDADIYEYLPDMAQEWQKWHSQETHQGAHFECTHNGKFLDCTLYPITNDQGTALRMAVYITDVTQRHRIEAQNQYQANLLQHVSDAIIATDQEFRITSWNRAAEALYGWAAEDVMGETVSKIVQTQFADTATHEDSSATLKAAGYWEGEVIQYTKDGTPLNIYARVSLVPDEQGSQVDVVAANRDITARKRVEAALQARTDELNERVKELKCLYNIAELIETPDISLEAILQGAVNLIPTSWKHTRIASARVRLENQEYRSQDYAESPVQMASNILVSGKPAGILEVCYHPDKAHANAAHTNAAHTDDPTFLEEERQLLQAITGRLGRTIERFRAEELLRYSEERFQVLSETTFEGVAITENGIIIDANRRFPEILGYAFSAVIGKPLRDLVIPAEREAVDSHLRSGHAHLHEHRMQRRDGTIVAVEVYAHDVTYRERQVRVTAIRDISERVKAQEERDRLFNLSLDMFSIAGFDGYFKQLNPAWQVVLGWDETDLLAAPWLDFVHPDDRHATEVEMARLQRGEMVRGFENRYRCKDGTCRWLAWNSFPLLDDNLIFSVTRDVTEQKAAEDALRQSTERLQILHEVDHAILLAQSPASTAEVVLQRIRQLIPCQYATVGLVDQDAGEWHILAAHAAETVHIQPETRSPLDAHWVTLLEQNRIVLAHGIAQFPESLPALDALRAVGFQSLMIAPLRVQDTLLGAVNLMATAEHFFTWESVEIVRQMADSLAIAISQANLHEQVRQYATQLEQLVEQRTGELTTTNAQLQREIGERILAENSLRWELDVNAALSELYKPLTIASLSFSEITGVILEQARKITGSVHGYVSAIDSVTQDNIGYTLTEMLGKSCAVKGGDLRVVFPISRSGEYGALWGHVLNTRQAFYTNTPQSHPDSTGTPEGHIPLEQFLSVPVILGAELIGQIALANPERDYTDRDLIAVQRIAEFYALAIQRKRVEDEREQSQQREREQRIFTEALNDIAVSLMSTPDLGEVLDRILDTVGRVVPHSAANATVFHEGEIRILRHHGYEKYMSVENAASIAKRLRDVWKQDDSSWQTVTRIQRPMLIPDTHTDPMWVIYPGGDWVRSWLAVPILQEDIVLGTVMLDSSIPGFFQPHHVARLQAFANAAGVAIKNAQLYEQSARVAVLEERSRLAGELHDAVSQTLWSAKLITDMLPALWERDPDMGRKTLSDLGEMTQAAIAEMRTLLLELRPDQLIESPLEEVLTQLAHTLGSRSGLQFNLALNPVALDDANVKIALYRLAQESCNNIIRHAGASEVFLQLHDYPDRIELHIRDNGRGFDPDRVRSGRLGLENMKQRVAAIGATLKMTSKPGVGTKVTVIWQKQGG